MASKRQIVRWEPVIASATPREKTRELCNHFGEFQAAFASARITSE
jgi:hypothetical protein